MAVSPFVDGRSVKGPSEHFCAWAGIETSAAGIARAYADVIDAVVADEPVDGLPHLVTDTLMDGTEGMRQLARKILEFGRSLARLRQRAGRRFALLSPRPARSPMSTIAILPVKSFGAAKQRLAAALGAGSRQALAQAMFSDVLASLRRVPGARLGGGGHRRPGRRVGGARRARRRCCATPSRRGSRRPP